MTATGTAKTTVWRWQERFLAEGAVETTLKPPPHQATHWTAQAMAKAAGLAVSTKQRIWKAHGLAPHR